MSRTRVDLPEPLTPVTTVMTLSGKRTSMPRRLLAPCAFHFDIVCPWAYAVRQGDGFLPRQYFTV